MFAYWGAIEPEYPRRLLRVKHDLVATDETPVVGKIVVGDELGDEVGAWGVGGGEVKADEVEEAEGVDASVVGAIRRPQWWPLRPRPP